MPARFSRRANAAVRWAFAAVLVTPPVVISVLLGWVRTPYATGQGDLLEQPVPFDHRHHVADDLIDCRYCHTTVERTASAGIPSAEQCMGCHAQIWSTSPLLEPVRESYDSGRPIAWRRVHRLPDFVFFDHSVHVTHGVGCETCHGRVDRMARVYQVAPLTMGWCLECHRSPAEHLRPVSAVTAMGWRPRAGPVHEPGPEDDGDLSGPGEVLAAAYRVDPGTDCTTCHR